MPTLEPVNHLGCLRYFRNKHNCLFSASQHLRNQLHVHFCFSAPVTVAALPPSPPSRCSLDPSGAAFAHRWVLGWPEVASSHGSTLLLFRKIHGLFSLLPETLTIIARSATVPIRFPSGFQALICCAFIVAFSQFSTSGRPRALLMNFPSLVWYFSIQLRLSVGSSAALAPSQDHLYTRAFFTSVFFHTMTFIHAMTFFIPRFSFYRFLHNRAFFLPRLSFISSTHDHAS